MTQGQCHYYIILSYILGYDNVSWRLYDPSLPLILRSGSRDSNPPPGLTPMIGHSIREVETNRNIAANIKFIVLIMKSPSCAVVQTCFEITNNKQEANGGDDNRNKT